MFEVQSITLESGFTVGPVQARIESATVRRDNPDADQRLYYIVALANGDALVERRGFNCAYQGGNAEAEAEADAMVRL